MLPYIVGLLLFLTTYKRVNLFLIRRFLKKSETLPILNGAEPFFLDGKSKNGIGVLLLHGFTATPGEMRNVGKFLNQMGLTVYAPLLSGHGTDPRNLLLTKHDAWLRDLDKSLNVLDGCCKKIFLVGNSFGGNLAFLCQGRSKKIEGIVSLASPFVFRNENVRKSILHALKHFKLFQRKRYPKKIKKIYKKKRRISYNEIPLYSLIEMNQIIKKSKEILPKIKTKLLLMQSTNDNIVSKNSVGFIYNKVLSKDKKIVWVKDSIHVFIEDESDKGVFKEIYNFIIEN